MKKTVLTDTGGPSMNASAGPIRAYRRYWLPELAALATLTLASVILFSVTDLDIATVRWFYHQELAYPWPDANLLLWSLLYRSAPWVTGSLAMAGAALLVSGVVRKHERRLRWYGLFIFLCVILGPGLIVNVALKDHWGRPRPRQIVEFGGQFHYVRPLLPAGVRGKSFACGHCSVGYLYGIGWWLWRRRRPRLASASLAMGLVLGTLLGFGRMAAGAHFLSDAVWSALIAYGIAHGLYYYVLRVPAREDSRSTVYPLLENSPRLKAATIAAVVLLSAGVIAGGILASPIDKGLTVRIPLAAFPAPPERFEVFADTLDVELLLVAEPRGAIDCTGSIHGFGLPNNEIDVAWEFDKRPVPTLRYRVTPKGFFTDIDGEARFRLSVQDVRTIKVRVRHGDISVVDATGGLAAGRFPALDLDTAEGRVRQP